MAKLTSRYAVYISLAFILSYLESLIWLPIPIPGIKPGLANIVIVFVLYDTGRIRDVLAVSLVRIILSSLIFGNMVMMIYSLCGGMLSAFLMIAAKKMKRFGIIGVSIIGGISHNIGQLAVAAVTLLTYQLIYYMPVLIISGTVSGFLVGLFSGICVKRISGYNGGT